MEQSVLTPRQLEALRLYLRVAIGEMKYKEAAAKASEGRTRGEPRTLTVGSYFRTVQQARNKIRKSVVTLLIGVWVGIVKIEDVRKLLEVSGGGSRELTDEEAARLAAVLRALTQKIVM